jgi:hypothetical protein
MPFLQKKFDGVVNQTNTTLTYFDSTATVQFKNLNGTAATINGVCPDITKQFNTDLFDLLDQTGLITHEYNEVEVKKEGSEEGSEETVIEQIQDDYHFVLFGIRFTSICKLCNQYGTEAVYCVRPCIYRDGGGTGSTNPADDCYGIQYYPSRVSTNTLYLGFSGVDSVIVQSEYRTDILNKHCNYTINVYYNDNYVYVTYSIDGRTIPLFFATEGECIATDNSDKDLEKVVYITPCPNYNNYTTINSVSAMNEFCDTISTSVLCDTNMMYTSHNIVKASDPGNTFLKTCRFNVNKLAYFTPNYNNRLHDRAIDLNSKLSNKYIKRKPVCLCGTIDFGDNILMADPNVMTAGNYYLIDGDTYYYPGHAAKSQTATTYPEPSRIYNCDFLLKI